MGEKEVACCLGICGCCTVVFIILAALSFSVVEPLEWGLKYSSISKQITDTNSKITNPTHIYFSLYGRKVLVMADKYICHFPKNLLNY